MKLETIKIASKDRKSGFIIINKSDFDEKIHKEFKLESKPSKPKDSKPKARKSKKAD